MSRLHILIAAILSGTLGGDVFAVEGMPSLEKASMRLRQATVTVRVTSGPESDRDGPVAKPDRVAVCSGVLIDDSKLIVTSVPISASDQVRITLPDGQQRQASLAVVDHYSRLALLESSGEKHEGLSPENRVKGCVGGWVVSGAAWGTEDAVVRLGIISGLERSLAGVDSPPLLQCDMRSARTSSGAALVDQDGHWLGVVVASEDSEEHGDWTFAVPISHVQRLLRAHVPGKRTVLKRQRPVLGVIMGAGTEPGQVVVQRVVAGGPADQAGLRVEDRVVAVDGRRIRSVYQALRPVLKKQPSDQVTLTVERAGDGRQDLLVTLAGGVQMPSADVPADRSAKRVEVSRQAAHYFQIGDSQGTVRDLRLEDADRPTKPERAQDDAIEYLQRAVDQYGALVNHYRIELKRRREENQELEKQVSQLQAEIGQLQQAVTHSEPQ